MYKLRLFTWYFLTNILCTQDIYFEVIIIMIKNYGKNKKIRIQFKRKKQVQIENYGKTIYSNNCRSNNWLRIILKIWAKFICINSIHLHLIRRAKKSFINMDVFWLIINYYSIQFSILGYNYNINKSLIKPQLQKDNFSLDNQSLAKIFWS